MLKTSISYVLKIIVAFIITIAICWVINLFAFFIADNYLIKKHLVRWTLYTGFADLIFLIFSFLLSFFIMNSKIEKVKLYHIIGFICLYLFVDFAFDMIADYQSSYWATSANGPYSYEIFKRQATYRLDVVHYLTKNFTTFIVYELSCFIAIICISIVSMKIKKIKILDLSK